MQPRGEEDAKLEQLPAEAPVHPRVLPGQPTDQGRNMLRCPGPACAMLATFTVIPLLLPLQAALPGQDRLRFDDSCPLFHQRPAHSQRGLCQRPAFLVGEPDAPRHLLLENAVLQTEILVLQHQLPPEQVGQRGNHRQVHAIRSSFDAILHPRCR